MCQVSMIDVYKITVLQPHPDISEMTSISDATLLAALSAVLLAGITALAAFHMTDGHRQILRYKLDFLITRLESSINKLQSSINRLEFSINRQSRFNAISATILCFIILAQGTAFCQISQELTVLGPADNFLGDTIKDFSQSFSDANNIPVNITQIRGREMIVKEVMKDTSKADVVILENGFPLFNLSGMGKLKKEMLIDNCTYLYSEKALLISKKDDAISSLGELDGKIIAVTDQHVPGACLAKKIVDKEGLNVSEVNESSNEAQLDAVAAGRADATVLWESMFNGYANSTNPEIEAVDLTDYRMDNFIAVLNKSKNPEKAEMYVKYLLAALASGSHDSKVALKET